MNKKADEKYYLIISFILVVMIVGISLFFLFKEYFTSEEMNWETCRQSIQLRGAIPQISKFDFFTLKEKFPLKCQTQVIDIKETKAEDAMKKIADTLASCHYMFGEGKLVIYGVDKTYGDTMCLVCARMYFDKNVIRSFTNLDMGNYLINTKYRGSQTYFEYLYTNRPSKVPIETLKQQVISESKMSVSNGDIYVTYYYKKDSYFASGWWAVIKFYQSNILDKALGVCSSIETIPA